LCHNNELQMCQSSKQIIQQRPTKQIVLNYHILQFPQPLVVCVPFNLAKKKSVPTYAHDMI
jgi:hypothetical protein